MRNRNIYAQSSGTVVIRSDRGKGGTWAGATEDLKKRWCPVFCRDYNYPGNKELIRLGAIPVIEEWDGNVDVEMPETQQLSELERPVQMGEQISLFDI